METEITAAEPAHEDAPDSVPESGGDGGSFWKSAPGVLTGITGLIGAITALVTGLSHAGLIGPRKADAQVVASPSPTPSPISSPMASPRADPDDDGNLHAYRVYAPGDGFSWVRKEPTKESPGVATLVSGTPVKCRDAVPDPDPSTGRKWHFCPAEGGYISTRLLRLASPAS